jgi:hypothetical protein
MKRAICLLLICIGFMTTAKHASAAQQQPLTEEEAFQLGVDAYIYGYPLLVMDSLRRVSTNVVEPEGTSAPMGQFAHHRSFPDASKREIAGASVDTLYSLAWLDLSRDTYVLHLPDAHGRFYLMPILDGWTEVSRTRGREPPAIKPGITQSPDRNGRGPFRPESIKSNPTPIWCCS